jgi:hypothetical protein
MSWPHRRSVGLATIILAVALLIIVGWINYSNLDEAYGSGPPYYGRTTNMDKWSDPTLALIVLDAAALLVCGALVWVGSRLLGRTTPVDGSS